MSHTQTKEIKRIPIGSGHLYCIKFAGTIPTDAEFETEENRIGYIQSGASLEYTPSFYNAKDDLGKVKKTIITEETAKLKYGLCTWNANVVDKLVPTGTVTEADGKRTLKIGGIENQENINYLFRFVNKDPVDGDIRITVAGNNQAGVVMAFAKDKESTLNPEIELVPIDDGGTLIIFEEEVVEETPEGRLVKPETTTYAVSGYDDEGEG